MVLHPYISNQFNGTIWRMDIDPGTCTLFAEVRNEIDKQVSFAAVNLASGHIHFGHLTTDERWLTGMEGAYNGVMLLHGYESAGSPAHKGLTAIDGVSGQILWANYNYTFNHLCVKGPVCFDARLQPRKLFVADILTGAISGPYNAVIDEDLDLQIVLPDMVSADLLGLTGLPEAPFGNIAHLLDYNNYRIVSLHPLINGQLSQRLYVFKDGQQVFTDLLATGIQKLQPEAFVMHHKHLIYLKNRCELNVINLEN